MPSAIEQAENTTMGDKCGHSGIEKSPEYGVSDQRSATSAKSTC